MRQDSRGVVSQEPGPVGRNLVNTLDTLYVDMYCLLTVPLCDQSNHIALGGAPRLDRHHTKKGGILMIMEELSAVDAQEVDASVWIIGTSVAVAVGVAILIAC
jgi:hypothetical protein